MPRPCRLASFAAALLLAALPAFAQHTPANENPEKECDCKNKTNANLLPNGEFETTAKGSLLPEHWTAANPNSARVIDLSDDFRRAVQIQGAPQQMAGDGIQLISDPVKVQMHKRYRCRGYIRSEAPRQDVIIRGYINVPRVVDGRTQMVEQVVTELRKPWKPLNEWRHFAFEFDMQPVMQSGQPRAIDHVRVILVSHQYGGICWFDDVRLETIVEEKPAQ